jgi:class 3 adenylate cyclase
MLDRLNARNRDATLHAHIGLDFGPGIVEQQQVWGDVINRAKRCQTIAGPDEIVVSATLAEAVGEPSPWTLERLTGNLKGFGEVDVFQVRWQIDG